MKFCTSFCLLFLLLQSTFISGQTIINKDKDDNNSGYYLSDSLVEFNVKVNGKKEGWWVSKFFFNKTLYKRASFFVNNSMNGDDIQFYKSGKLKQRGNYNKGKEDGIFLIFSKDGRKHYRVRYKNGKYIERLPAQAPDNF